MELFRETVPDFWGVKVNEALLEPLLRRFRLRHVSPVIRHYRDCRLLDVGCGASASLLRRYVADVRYAAGIDRRIVNGAEQQNLDLRQGDLGDPLPFPGSSFDVVTLLAVIEHVDDPIFLLSECARVLDRGGTLVITAPSWKAKPLLEFLAFKLHLVSSYEIADHKRYYDFNDLNRSIKAVNGLSLIKHRYFQFGYNNFCLARRI